MRNRLLLVDGDPRTLRVLDVSLRNAGYEVDTAISGSDAWAMLENSAPDLIIAESELGGIDGFELCARLRRNPVGATIPFVFLAADKTLNQKIRALEAGANDYLVKPAYVKEVLARVRALLQRRDRERLASGQDERGRQEAQGGIVGSGPDGRVVADHFAGSIADITVVDLVQVLEGNGRSGIVHLRGTHGAPASIYFRHGKVVDAEVGRLSGIDALSRLFSWSDGSFELEWKSIRRKDAIGRPSAELVIEGMRRLDEWNRLLEQLPDVNAIFEVDYRLLAERLAEIPDEVNGILRLCDGVRNIMQVVEDCAIPDIEALTAMIRLREEGIVYELSGGRAPERQTDSTRLGGWLGSGSTPFPSSSPGHVETGRIGIGSGPVQQSFADRLQVEAEARDDLPAAGAQVASPESNVEREEGPRRRRTAPGLGQAAPDLSSVAQAIPEARFGQAEDNVIKFPAPGDPRPGGSASARSGPVIPDADSAPPAIPASDNTASLGAAADFSGPEAPASAGSPFVTPGSVGPPLSVGLTLPLGLAGELVAAHAGTPTSEGARVSAENPPLASFSMTETHRGFGIPVPNDVRGELGVPEPLPDRDSGRFRQSGSVSESGNVASHSSRTEGLSEPTPVSAREPTAESTPESAASTDRGGRHLVPPGGDTTMRVSFSDQEISRTDALDELGLPSRWRGLRFLVGALVVGTLAAVVVHRFRSKTANSEHGSRAAETGVGGAQPPVVVPGRGPVVIPTTPPPPAIVLPGTPAVGSATQATGAGTVSASTPVPSQPGAPAANRAAPPPGADSPKAPPNTSPGPRVPTLASPVAGETPSSSGVAARPAVETTRPGAEATRPAVEATRPAVMAARPAVEATRPAVVAARPGAEATRPAVVAARPGAEATRPAVVAARPAVEATRPAVEATRPAVVAARPAAATVPPAGAEPARQLADCRGAFSRNRMRDALTACTAAVASSPNSAEALTMLAHTELNRGRLARSIQLAQKAVTIDPNLADAYVIIGGVHQDSGQNREAKVAYRRYLQLAPQGRYADELRSIVNRL